MRFIRGMVIGSALVAAFWAGLVVIVMASFR
jgi:hypothetical protein